MVGGKEVLMKIGRLLIVWFTDKKLMDDVMKLLNGGYHISKNPPKGVKRKRKEAEGENRMEGR
jgi:hypothetical protein